MDQEKEKPSPMGTSQEMPSEPLNSENKMPEQTAGGMMNSDQNQKQAFNANL